MGICRHCQRGAGFFRRRHPDCHHAFRSAVKTIPQMVAERIVIGGDTRALWQEVQAVAALGHVPPDTRTALVVRGWGQALDAFLYADGTMTPAQAQCLRDAAGHLQIEPGHLQT